MNWFGGRPVGPGISLARLCMTTEETLTAFERYLATLVR